MNSPLLTLGSIFLISAVLSSVTGDTPKLSSCEGFLAIVYVGVPCYIHCSVTDWQDGDEIEIRKLEVEYHGFDGQTINKPMDVEYYNSNTGLNPDLPARYTVEPRNNEVNISISAVLAEDMGSFECWTTRGNVITKSGRETLIVTSNAANRNWARLDESGSVVESFENNTEITIEYDDIESLAFRIDVTEPVSVKPEIHLTASPFDYITPAFRQATHTEPGDISEVGLIEGFNSTATFASPDVGHSSISSLSLSSIVVFQDETRLGGHFKLPAQTLRLNVQAPPQFQISRCSTSFDAEIGDTIVFNCRCASNPGSPSFALQLPGRDERIESGEDDKFGFNVTKSESEYTPYLYYLELTYKNIADEVFGTNQLYARNEKGESAYEFTISAGSKPGLPLLVTVISSLIAIASFSSRF